MNFKAQQEDDKKRLDKFLVEKMPQYSRSKLKKMIEQGFVTVNKAIPSVHQFLKEQDLIAVTIPEKKEPEPIPELEVLAKGDGYLVINKPAGMLTHHAQGTNHEATVADWLIANYPEAKTVGDPERPGIVHRLDRDTSGAMLLALTQSMYESLKGQFHDRQIKKTYIALVHENLPTKSGTIDKPIGRSKKDGRMAARTKALSESDREAITDYEVITSYKKFDLVKAYPKTGRTHQIRVHLMSLGHPIVGDKIYTIHGQKKVIELGRIFLHATALEFTDEQGKLIHVSSPLPSQLEEFLTSLKK